MAINTQKFLPSSIGGKDVTSSKMSNSFEKKLDDLLKTVRKTTKINKVLESEEDGGGALVVRKKVIEIKDIVSSTTLIKNAEIERKRKQDEKTERSKKEEKIEEKQTKETRQLNLPSIPKLGFLDRVKNFITSVLFGYIAYRLVDYLPKFLEFAKIVGPAFDFLIDFSGNLFNGLVSFIDWGYQAVEKTEKFIKDVGGENTLKLFKQFEGALTTFVNTSLILGMLSSGGKQKVNPPRIGFDSSGKKIKPQVQERYLKRFGKNAFTNRFGVKNLNNISKGSGRLLTKGIARVPIIGALIDLAINLAMGEPIGRAAAKAAGAAVGSALGTFIPIPLAGTILGGILGDIVGGALYDTLINTEKQAAAEGGQITRGNKPTGGPVTRTIRKKPTKRTLTVKSTPIKPGADVGGENKIKKIYPEAEKTDQVNPYGFMKKSSKIMTSADAFGPLFALQSKAQVGQRPTKTDYRNAAQGLNAWMNNAFAEGVTRGGTAAYAGGGSVEVSSLLSGDSDMTDWIEKSIHDFVSPKIDNIIKDLTNNLALRTLEVKKESIEEPPVEGEDLGTATDAVGGARMLMAAGFPMLAAAILAGNIQAESAWRGQRTPWVLNDGAGTNKGLISWNRSRIVNAEKFLGKPLETASNAEQIKWIKEELRQYGLLDEFLNPNSTEEQLKRASYKYIGWGIEGDRWQQSSRIFAALQRGEQGTYLRGSGSTYNSGMGPVDIVPNARGTKISGDLGDFMRSWGRVPGSIWQHSRHGGKGSRSYSSFHNVDRAIDIGAYANEQGPILKKIEEFNRLKGVKPVQLLHAGNDPSGIHDNHVHVAYAVGGRVSKPTRALIGEKGPEFIFDADTTKGLDQMMPNLLEHLNAAKNKRELSEVLESYAGYENPANQTIAVKLPAPKIIIKEVPIPIMNSGMSVNGYGNDPFANLTSAQ
jgi:hypothetical protein